jgi:hypothetical protein
MHTAMFLVGYGVVSCAVAVLFGRFIRIGHGGSIPDERLMPETRRQSTGDLLALNTAIGSSRRFAEPEKSAHVEENARVTSEAVKAG